MLSDRFRLLKIALLSLLLTVLCLYNYIIGPPRLLSEVQARIARPAEQTAPARVGFARVIEVRDDGTARMLIWGHERVVQGAVETLQEGDIVSFTGLFTSGGRIDLQTVTVHRFRWLKKAVSLAAALILFGVLAFRAARGFFRKGESCRT